jgi:hypothetical protein
MLWELLQIMIYAYSEHSILFLINMLWIIYFKVFLMNMLWVLCFIVCLSLTCDEYYVLRSVSHEYAMGLMFQGLSLINILWVLRLRSVSHEHAKGSYVALYVSH